MKTIPFPAHCKKALLEGKKNTTIRIRDEIGKYKKEETYKGQSYASSDWETNIKVTDVTHTTVNGLLDFKIPRQTW